MRDLFWSRRYSMFFLGSSSTATVARVHIRVVLILFRAPFWGPVTRVPRKAPDSGNVLP